MSMQRLKNAVMEADARGFKLKLQPEGVVVVARWGVESWHKLASWSSIEQDEHCPITLAMEGIGREIIELRKGVVGKAGMQ